jgi:uncharacterized protein YoxC
MTWTEVFLGVITLAVVAFVVFSIWAITRLVATLNSANVLLATTDKSMREVMAELGQNLASLRGVTDNMNSVAEDLQSLSGAVRGMGEGIRFMTDSVRRIGETVQGAGSEALSSIRGVRAGVKAGFEVLLKNLFQFGAR